MSEMITIPKKDLTQLKGRLSGLARDKANIQLVMNMMTSLMAVRGLDDAIERVLQIVLEHVGGIDIAIFYRMDEDLFYADVLGERKRLDTIEDPLVQRVFRTHEFVELEHDFSDTRMTTPEFGRASTWVFPLVVGRDLIGVFKIESTHLPARDLRAFLPTFFSHAALILKNEIFSYSRLQKAYAELEQETIVRRQTEQELREAKAGLEEKVAVRTAELRRANRLYDVLSHINQATIRATSREELLSEVCRIAVDHGEFHFAWIGMVNGETLDVIPVASAGPETDYVAQLKITVRDTSEGLGPVGTAIREAKPCFSNDLLNDPRMALWRDAAQRAGLQAVVAVPIRCGGQVEGAIAIYSIETDVFHEKEVALLEEIAADVSMGLDRINAEAERKRSEAALHASEKKYRSLIHRIQAAVVVHGADTRVVACNPMAEVLLGLTEAQLLGKAAIDPDWHFFKEDGSVMPVAGYPVNQVLATGQSLRNRVAGVHRPGRDDDLWVLVSADPVRGDDGIAEVVVTFIDITDRKRAEQERLTHLRFFECMDQVNRAMQGTNDLEKMTRDVLDVVLSIFECDRAFLMHPCDPGVAVWQVPMERNKPEYPGVLALGLEMPMDADVAGTLRLLLASDGPVQFGPGTPHPLPADVSERFGFKSFMSVAVRPQVGAPWQFGIHQCAYARIWTADEERLFQEIARRLGDALTGLLAYRDLRESRERFRGLFENSPIPIWEEDCSGVKAILDALRVEGIDNIETYLDQHPEVVERCAKSIRVKDVNRAALVMHGAASKEDLFSGLGRIFTSESYAAFQRELVAIWNGQTGMQNDAVVQTLDGERRHAVVHLSVRPGSEETLSEVLVSLMDITERKRAEREGEALVDLLRLLNTSADTHSMVRSATAFFSLMADCEAVGVRLRSGEDFPYFETRGFSAEFVQAESRLCATDERGELVRDSTGSPALDCMCGNILCGRFDPSKPFFTAHGSFWTNCTTDLLASTTEADRQSRTRNRCNGEGYESVALLPLRAGETTFGLLQLNDRRRGCLTPEKIALLEQLAGHLAIGLARRQAEAALRESEDRYRTVADFTHDWEIWRDPDGKLLYCSPACERITGYRAEEFVREPGLDVAIVHPDDRARVVSHSAEAPGIAAEFEELEYRIRTRNGEERWIAHACRRVCGRNGEYLGRRASNRDITERKRAEREHLAHLRFLEAMDQVNRAIQGARDVDTMMGDVLDVVLPIFDCDRTWLFYPCDPDAPSFRVPMEITKPEYPGAKVLNVDAPMPPDMARNLREALESADPVTYTVGTERPINKVSAEQFGVKSMMMTALRPKTGKPWAFGLHQCSYPRVWTSAEERLFQEIGRRLADALSSLLFQREVRAGETKYRRLVDAANEGIWMLGEDHLTTSVNARMADLLGCRSEEMINRPVTDFMFDEDIPDHQRRMETRRRGLPEHYERRFRDKNGQPVWTIVSAVPILDTDQNFQGAFAMFTDISERKRAEAALTEAHDRLRASLDAIPDLMFEVDRTGRMYDYHAPQDELLFAPPETFLGKTVAEVLPEDAAAVVLEAIAGASRDGRHRGGIYALDLPVGRRWFELSIARKGELDAIEKRFIVLAREVTERKHAEEEIRRIAEEWQTTFDSIADLVSIQDADFKLVRVNKAYARTFGTTPEALIGRRCYEVVHGTACPVPDCPHERTVRTGEAALEELLEPRLGVCLEVSTFPVINAAGKIVGSIHIAKNVTERKRAEAELQFRNVLLSTQQEVSIDGILVVDEKDCILSYNRRFVEMWGLPAKLVEDRVDEPVLQLVTAQMADPPSFLQRVQYLYKHNRETSQDELILADGRVFDRYSAPMFGPDERYYGRVWYFRDITDRKRTEEALEKRLVALTRPLDNAANITFDELFNLDDLQRLQDEFARATGVASIITHPDGTPITAPSSFCRLCSDIIRKTQKGCANCYRSDAEIGRPSIHGPTIQPCMSGGLWDAGAGISVGGRHIANWLIGQVRDSTQTEEKMRAYAREIGADEAAAMEAFREVPGMSREQFEQVAQALFTLADQLSSTAYQNVQQARFISDRKRAEEALRHSEQEKSLLNEIANVFLTTPDEEMYASVLAVVLRVMESPFGLFGYLGENGDLVVPTLTMGIWDECRVPGKSAVFPSISWGDSLWGRAIRERMALGSDGPFRTPAGHIPIDHFLTTPIVFAQETIGLISVANKEGGYTIEDKDVLGGIAAYASPILNARLQRDAQERSRVEAENEIHRLNTELEQRVRDRTAELESANKELEAFSYSVSHDLRAPLRHLAGFVKLLTRQEGGHLDEQSTHYLDVIGSSAVEMGKLIDDILSFSRMGRAEMLRTRVSMGSLLNEVLRLLERDVRGRDVLWKVNPLPDVYGSPEMIRIVWTNLISNAIKFTAQRVQAIIEVGCSGGDTDEDVFYVRDNGAGFDMRYVDKLFGLFQRLHRADEFEGTGVGLANTRRIIARHGGTTWAEGIVGEGATFYFSLPKRKKER